MASNIIIRKRVDDIQAKAKAETEWWEKKRATIQSEFMKELNEGSEDPTAPAATPQKQSAPAVTAEKGGSDEDTVIVEGGGPAAAGAKGSAKKKKGKK